MSDIEESDPLLDTEDFSAYQAARDAGEQPESEPEAAPAVGEEETPPSESADEAGQTAAESDPEEDLEQAALEAEQAELEALTETTPAKGEAGKRLARRMRELTGEIKALKSRLEEQETPAEADDEGAGEVVSPPVVAAPAAVEAVEPVLRDFEDNDETGESAWDQYAKALRAFNKAETAKAIAAARAEQKAQDAQEHAVKEAETAKAAAQADWNKAAARFPNFNEMARAEIQISTAMENVMRMDPEQGTALVMYFGEHPEEAKQIALRTLAKNEAEWGTALARAGIELGKIAAKLKPPPSGGPALVKTAPKGAPTAPAIPTTKKITSASRPPTQIRGGTATPKFDTTNEDDAGDFEKWEKQRVKELAQTGRR